MSFNILHISDFHFGLLGKTQVEKVTKSFIENMKVMDPELKPDFIVVSGDITNDAKDGQFDQAKDFLDQLYLALFEETPGRLLCVPGNHDKFRHPQLDEFILLDLIEKIKKDCPKHIPEFDIKKALRGLDRIIKRKKITEEKDKYNVERTSLFDSAKNLNDYSEKHFKDYSNFSSHFIDQISKWFPIKIEDTVVAEKIIGIAKYDFCNAIFVLLNTSWLCQNSQLDNGRLSLGKNIIGAINEKVQEVKSDNDIVITVMHHCPNNFQWNDIHDMAGEINNLAIVSKFSNIILSGHEHSAQIDKPDFIDNNAQLFSTGTFYLKDRREFSCSIYKIDNCERKISLTSLTFKLSNTHPEGAWLADTIDSFSLSNPTDLLEENKKLINTNKKLKEKNRKLKWLNDKSKT